MTPEFTNEEILVMTNCIRIASEDGSIDSFDPEGTIRDSIRQKLKTIVVDAGLRKYAEDGRHWRSAKKPDDRVHVHLVGKKKKPIGRVHVHMVEKKDRP